MSGGRGHPAGAQDWRDFQGEDKRVAEHEKKEAREREPLGYMALPLPVWSRPCVRTCATRTLQSLFSAALLSLVVLAVLFVQQSVQARPRARAGRPR